jgi:hypothetical protein
MKDPSTEGELGIPERTKVLSILIIHSQTTPNGFEATWINMITAGSEPTAPER